jgi:hypothetical protein
MNIALNSLPHVLSALPLRDITLATLLVVLTMPFRHTAQGLWEAWWRR